MPEGNEKTKQNTLLSGKVQIVSVMFKVSQFPRSMRSLSVQSCCLPRKKSFSVLQIIRLHF